MESIFNWLATIALGMALVSTAASKGTPPPCTAGVCFVNDASKLAYEKANNCTFQSTACSTLNAQTQCCVTDPKTHQQTLIDKQITKPPASFNWTTYVQECPKMHQSDSPPDALWKTCVPGKIQDPSDATDFYTIIKAQKNSTNPNARTYCIDGCSTPPKVVTALFNAGSFLVADRENPSGYPSASFEPACSNHDICYQTCSASLTQSACDEQLLAQSDAACATIPPDVTVKKIISGGKAGPLTIYTNVRDACMTAAKRMNQGLYLFGKAAFQTRREQYCKCC
jgi:hypothetical protein